MESCEHEQVKDRRWLLLLAAAFGTLMLGFVPSAAWLNVTQDDPAGLLGVYALKQLLTVTLLCAVPAFWARLCHCTSVWSLFGLALLAYGVGFFVTKDPVQALYTPLLIAVPGAGLFAVQKLAANNFRAVLYQSALVLLALFGYVCLPTLLSDGDAYLPFRTVIGAYQSLMLKTQTMLGVSAEMPLYEDFTAIMDMMREYKLNAESFGVPVLMLPAMTIGLSNVLFSHLMNRRGGVVLQKLPPFSEWRCERTFVIAALVFAIASYLLQFTGWNGMEALAGVGSMLWRMPCALAGLSAAYWVSVKRRKRWIFVIVCCVSAAMPLFGLMLLALLGMLFSLRKRTNGNEKGTQP